MGLSARFWSYGLTFLGGNVVLVNQTAPIDFVHGARSSWPSMVIGKTRGDLFSDTDCGLKALKGQVFFYFLVVITSLMTRPVRWGWTDFLLPRTPLRTAFGPLDGQKTPILAA